MPAKKAGKKGWIMQGKEVLEIMDVLKGMHVGYRALERPNQVDQYIHIPGHHCVDVESRENGAWHRHSLSSDDINFVNLNRDSHYLEMDPACTFSIEWSTTYFPKSRTKISETVTRIIVTPRAKLEEVLAALKKGAPN